MNRQHIGRLLISLTTLIALLGVVRVSSVSAQNSITVSGVLSVLYGDSQDSAQTIFRLTTPTGETLQLTVPPDVLAAAGGIFAIHGQPATVTLDASDAQSFTLDAPVTAQAITLERAPEGQTFGGVSPQDAFAGSLPWVNLLCKFPDGGFTPLTQSVINTWYSGGELRFLDHYWNEVSYGQITLSGVMTTNWVNLPHTTAQYLAMGFPDYLDAIFTDCTAAHSGSVTYSDYFGINLFFNDELDGYYWGTECELATVQGVNDCWRTTWLPYYGFYDLSAYTHEMGHTFGLPHSNNSDGDDDPYDNTYDIMSGSACVEVSQYGCLQQHVIALYKDLLGWFATQNIFTLDMPGSYSITLDRLNTQTSTNTYMVKGRGLQL